MTDSPRPTDRLADPLQTIRDDLRRRESEVANQVDRHARRERLAERLLDRFKDVISFTGGLLAPREHPRGDTFFADLARSLLAFNETLREADQEYPRYRILERLGRAARAGVPALDTAASLLLLEPVADVEGLARDLEQFQGSRPHDVWSMWLTYLLDQLMNSHNPPGRNSVPPDTTRDEWRKAELAFGCILFSDESFRVLQESMDQAACLIDDAMKSGGHRVLKRPPGRVRDLIAGFDPRALHWYGSEARSLPLLQPPPSIEVITEPESLRRQLDEVWTAANLLQIALDKWAEWFVGLRENGDAHPAIALDCADMARRAIKVLLTYRPNVQPFDRADEAALLAMLPPTPAWWGTGADDRLHDDGEGTGSKLTVRWQEDREFLDRYYRSPAWLQEKAVKLRAATTHLIDLLKSFPTTALASRRPPAKREEPARPERKIEAPSEIIGSLFSQAESRRRQEAEARRSAEERARRCKEHAALLERLAEAFDRAYTFTNEESQQGRKPCADGFRRWAERFLALGTVMRECDKAIEGLRLVERLRTVANRIAPDAMKFACALLLVATEGNANATASALEQANCDGKLRGFVLWLPFILDNLWMPFPGEDELIRVAQTPDGTSLEENQQAEQAFGWRSPNLSTDSTAVTAPVDRILDRATRRQDLLEQLRLIQERLEVRRSRVVEALRHFAATMPSQTPCSEEQIDPSDRRESLADALLSVCQAIREGGFSRGIELILNRDREDAGDNNRLAIDLYRRGWGGDRQGIVDLLSELDLLPAQGDNFDPTAACQHRVWDAVRGLFDSIVPWPPRDSVHFWHPDVVEASRLQDELAPQQEGQKAPPTGGVEEQMPPEQIIEVQAPAPPLTPLPADSSLSFLPGAFVYRGHREPLSGKPLEVLQALNEAQGKTLTLAALRDKVWPDCVTGEETIRSAVATARKALRRAIKANGGNDTADPLPAVDRGTNRTAWHLDLP